MASFFNNLSLTFRGNRLRESEIGSPTRFEQPVHVKVDPSSTTGFTGLPPQMAALLGVSGISKQEYEQNPQEVYNVLNFHLKGPKKQSDDRWKKNLQKKLRQKNSKRNLSAKFALAAGYAKFNLPSENELKMEVDAAVQIRNEDPFRAYTRMQQLGEGAGGVVYKVKSNQSSKVYALKSMTSDKMDDVKNEIALQSLSTAHPNIVSLVESFLHDNKLYVVIELMDAGALTDMVLDQAVNFTVKEISFVLREMLKGLAFMHAQYRLHRDIKSDNVLLDLNGRVKLADFGFAVSLTVDKDTRTSIVGTPYWMAPELVSGNNYDAKVDVGLLRPVWSTSITGIEMAEKSPPLMADGTPPMRALFLIVKNPSPKLQRPGSWSGGFVHFLKMGLMKKPSNRCTAEQLLMHPFMGERCKTREFAQFIKNKRLEV
eukprot:snap_masked-scaffold_36-processed-gene-2.40-mRNA-1 protein AED:0.03 eAED:0.03 QI:53/0.66/0.75/1/1/1/4/46/427